VIRAVLDANVFISAAVRPEEPPGQLFSLLLRDDAFVLVMSPAIATEIADALRYPTVRRCIRGRIDASQWLDSILPLADLVDDGALPTRASADPDDDRYLHAAVAGRASVVVSGDQHLFALNEYNGIPIVRPRAFLTLLVESKRRRPLAELRGKAKLAPGYDYKAARVGTR
jgi:putative PIN family toxin of toxin-antitoxin system